MDSGAKSSIQLAEELEVQLQKWKQQAEMQSNLLKNLHEMAMTPIANLR